MSLSYRFNFPLPNGLHARPASHLAEVARRFGGTTITLFNEARDATADLKSVLSMVAADVRKDDPCRLEFSGEEAQPAFDALRVFVATTLPGVDEPLPETAATAPAEVGLPRSLAAAGLGAHVRGTPVCGGVATGAAVWVRGAALPDAIEPANAPAGFAEELTRFGDALAKVSADIELQARRASKDAAAVLEAHRALVGDPELIAAVEQRLNAGRSAGQAVLEAGRGFIATLEKSASAYLRERVLDLQDVVVQLLEALGHERRGGEHPMLDGPSICVADHLTPGQLLSMDPALLRGLVLGAGGQTSHTVILARARGIPTLVDLGPGLARIPAGQEIVVDAELGLVAPLAEPAVRRYYDFETRRLDAVRRRNAESRTLPATPINGERALEVGANISSADEVAPARASGADGVGLFRTEMLFLGRDRAPTEAEQYEAYAKALADAGGAPVIIRTFDIGGDKPAPYLRLPHEANPFLGNRGVRLYESHPTLIRDQLRALLRAARHGNLNVMVPMIAAVEEVRAFRALVERMRDELIAEGHEVVMPSIGIMIEVPAAAMSVPQLAREADFFSIGSNDLTQYVLAADRDNPAVGELYTPLHPSFWRVMSTAAADARAAGRWIGLCGELAERADTLPLLVGLGLDEISTSATRIAEIKRRVRGLDRAACVALFERVMQAATRDEVAALLRDFAANAAAKPMLERDLIVLDSPAMTKAEAIKELADRLWAHDRASDGRAVEAALWGREDAYSTGFGHGCAVPHCKSSAITAGSIAVSRLAAPVAWNADGTNPVDLIIALCLREQDHGKQHLRVLAQLSRLLMRDEFRDAVRAAAGADELLAYLTQTLNL